MASAIIPSLLTIGDQRAPPGDPIRLVDAPQARRRDRIIDPPQAEP
jgi:hypothetical protein